MKPPYFSLNIRLLYSDPDPKSGSETGSEMFISVPDRIRIRPKVSYPSGSGSGSATLEKNIQIRILNTSSQTLEPFGR